MGLRKDLEKTRYLDTEFSSYPKYEIFTVNAGKTIRRENTGAGILKEWAE